MLPLAHLRRRLAAGLDVVGERGHRLLEGVDDLAGLAADDMLPNSMVWQYNSLFT